MRSPALRVALVVALTAVGAACHKRAPTKAPPSADAGAVEDASADSGDGDGGAQADEDTPSPSSEPDVDPATDTSPLMIQRVPFAPYPSGIGGRTTPRMAYVVRAKQSQRAPRLLANLHGVCNPPEYACGYWSRAAATWGTLVCPEGNSRCGTDGPSTWTQSTAKTDEDLERAIVAAGALRTERDILTGFSLGAYAAAEIARRHPGRWAYLILTEADVPLDAAKLRAAGVRAVAMVAGELGTQIHGERRTVAQLTAQKFPAKLFVMKKAGHHYSADVDDVMAEALAFVTSVK